MKKKRRETERQINADGSRRGKKSNIFPFICCFLIAFIIWAYTVAYGDTPQDASPTEGTQTSEQV